MVTQRHVTENVRVNAAFKGFQLAFLGAFTYLKYVLYFSNSAYFILNPLQSAGNFYTVQHTQGHSSAAIMEQSPALVSLPISHSEP